MSETSVLDLREIILRGRIALGLSARALAEKAGVSHSYISQIERGIIRRPSLLVLKRLSQLLPGISYSDLLKVAGYGQGMTARSETIIETDRQREIAQRLWEAAAEISKDAAGIVAAGFCSLPLCSTVPASFGVAAAEVAQDGDVERVLVHEARLRGDKQAYALRVFGDSMVDVGILEGDIVIVSPASAWRSGDICVVRLNGTEHSLKRLVIQDELIILQPCNSKYAPMVLPPERQAELHVYGKVIHCERSFP
jgi:SOS-response transcriptional repressor LexA